VTEMEQGIARPTVGSGDDDQAPVVAASICLMLTYLSADPTPC